MKKSSPKLDESRPLALRPLGVHQLVAVRGGTDIAATPRRQFIEIYP